MLYICCMHFSFLFDLFTFYIVFDFFFILSIACLLLFHVYLRSVVHFLPSFLFPHCFLLPFYPFVHILLLGSRIYLLLFSFYLFPLYFFIVVYYPPIAFILSMLMCDFINRFFFISPQKRLCFWSRWLIGLFVG